MIKLIIIITLTIYQYGIAENNIDKNLYLAVVTGKSDQTLKFLKKGANANYIDSNQRSLLSDSTFKGNFKLSKMLIKYEADINYQDKAGFTPLINATMNGHNQLVKFLLKNGANPNITTKSGLSPVIAATLNGDAKIISLLVDKNARTDQKYQSKTALELALLNKDQKIIKILQRK